MALLQSSNIRFVCGCLRIVQCLSFCTRGENVSRDKRVIKLNSHMTFRNTFHKFVLFPTSLQSVVEGFIHFNFSYVMSVSASYEYKATEV